MRFFGRDPVWYTNLVAAAVMGVSTFLLPLTIDQQGSLNAVAILIAGAITAWRVGDGQLSLVVNIFKAIIAVAISFGMNFSPEQQMAVMAVVVAVGSGFVRTQVVAPERLAPALEKR